MPLEPGQKLSHYRLIEKIGEGGMGVVWKARDEKLRRDVALKVLPPELVGDPERRRRLLREARTAAAVNHPNIAMVHEVDEAEGTVFIAMELVEGNTLRSLSQERPLAIREALRVATEVAEGLASAHAAGVIHRDLKPENVLVRPDGVVKILDFGLAKLHEDRQVRQSQLSQAETLTQEMTREGRILGTPAYMSPEQARGEAVDARSDLFSFGSMLYEMVVGRAPFEGRSATDILSAILRDRPPSPSSEKRGVPVELDRIVSKCLEKEPRDRYQHADELVVDLRKLHQTMETSAPEATTPSGGVAVPTKRSVRAPGRSWRIMASAGSAVLVVVVLTLVAWQLSFRTGSGGDPRTVLILPLEVRGEGTANDYVGRVFAEALLVNLAQAKELTVLPIPPPDLSTNTDPDVHRLAHELGAAWLLTGALTRQQGSTALSMSLVDVEANRVLWADQREATTKDLSGVAAGLAKDVASELGAAMPRLY